MKTLIILLSASAILLTFAHAAPAEAAEQTRIQTQSEVQNRFRNMSTDQLLEQQRVMAQDRDRDRDLLHKELKNRYRIMTQEQKRKFDQSPVENPIQQGMGQGSSGSTGSGGKGGR